MTRIERLKAAVKRSKIVQKVRRKAKDKAWKAYVKVRDAFRSRKKITAKRKDKLEKAKADNTGREKAVDWAWQQHGIKEQPAGSNTSPTIGVWQRHFGSWLVSQPWCGTFVGYALQTRGGIKEINSRVAAVAYIEDDAIAGRYGFKSWHGPTEGKRGDAVVLFGRGVHVELIVSKRDGYYVTVGGNTSAENSTGSQSNGGQVARRRRPFSQVRGCARPDYS